MSDQIFNRILRDLRVELSEEFDRNFERKAFFDQPWPPDKMHNRRGSLMLRSGYLRRSIRSEISGNAIRWISGAIYAELQNNGGQIRVTQKMRRFFWAMYYRATKKSKTGARVITPEAAMWKGLALKPVGSVIKVPARKFIGNHPQVNVSIERVLTENLKEIESYLKNLLKPQ